MSLALLRTRLAELVAPPAVAADLLPTGVAALDAALAGGLPRGRLTEIVGPLGSGTATLARRLVTGLVARGLGVAYVDAARTLDPADWAPLAPGHLRMVRPPEAARGAWCADVLLRSGAFVLVVLDGAPPLTRQQALRLVGLAREKDAAFVLVGQDRPSAVSGAVRVVVRRRWGGRPEAQAAQTQLLLERGGQRELIELPASLPRARRLGVHPDGPDRRGVGRGRGKRWKGARNGGTPVRSSQ